MPLTPLVAEPNFSLFWTNVYYSPETARKTYCGELRRRGPQVTEALRQSGPGKRKRAGMTTPARCPGCGQPVARTFCAACGTRVDQSELATPDRPTVRLPEPAGHGERVSADAEIPHNAWEPAPIRPAEPAADPFWSAEPARATQPGQRRSRRLIWIASIALAVAAIGTIAVVIGRRSDTRPAADDDRARTRSTGVTTTPPTGTLPPTSPPTAPPTVVPTATTSSQFVVQVGCGGAVCTLSIRDSPSPSASKVGQLDNAQVVDVSCLTSGALVTDADGLGSSSDWLRLADGSGYISSLYARGPQVQSC